MLTTNRTYLEVRTDKQRTTLKAVRCGALRYFYPARRNPNQTIDARSSPQSSFAACLPAVFTVSFPAVLCVHV